MSTNATIRIKREDGTKKALYLHHDGYVESAGVILQMFYNTPEKIEELLNMGDCSSLESTIEKSTFFNRDRGEKLYNHDYEEEYEYTFYEDEMVWYVKRNDYKSTKAEDLLDLGAIERESKLLLLDAILEADIEKWDYDNIPGKDVKEECIKRAQDARREIMKAKADQYDSYYAAYCN